MSDTFKAQLMSFVRHMITAGAGVLGFSAQGDTVQLGAALIVGAIGVIWGYYDKKDRG